MWLILSAAVAAPPLTPYRAEYEVLRDGKPLGRAVVSLIRRDAATWEFTSLTRGTRGLAGIAGAEISERATLHANDERLETIEYRFHQKMAWKSRERSVEIDAAGGRILSRDRRGEHRFDYQPGVLDRFSAALAMSRDVAAGKRGELSYLVVDRDEFGPERYRVSDEETVQVPAGNLRALKVERLRDDARGRSTTTWLGIEQDFLPVRMLQTEPDGDTFEMRLVEMTR
jgi:hypothetical protein